MSPRSNEASLSASQARAIDQVCDDFEDAWKTGQSHLVFFQEHLQRVTEAIRPALLRELIHIDCRYRMLAQETLAPAAYLQRFPDLDRGWLESFIAGLSPVAAFRATQPGVAIEPDPSTTGPCGLLGDAATAPYAWLPDGQPVPGYRLGAHSRPRRHGERSGKPAPGRRADGAQTRRDRGPLRPASPGVLGTRRTRAPPAPAGGPRLLAGGRIPRNRTRTRRREPARRSCSGARRADRRGLPEDQVLPYLADAAEALDT